MRSTPDRYSRGREIAVRATDDGWRRGFAEPDIEEDPPGATNQSSRKARSEGRTAGAGVFEGVDDRAVIKVTVDRSGLVADVMVAPTWRDTLAPSELGHALCTAANNALLSHLADTMAHPGSGPDNSGPDPGVSGRPLPRDLSMSELADLFNRFDRDFEDYRTALEATMNVTATAPGPNGRVTVTMTPGRVTEVAADPRWASHTRYTEIRAEALRAFQSATRELGNTDPSAVPLPPSLARLRELSDELARGTVS